MEEVRNAWLGDRSRPLANFYLPQMIVYFKSDIVLSSKACVNFDSNLQQLFHAKTRPCNEIISACINGLRKHSIEKPMLILISARHQPSLKSQRTTYLVIALAFPGAHGTDVSKLQSSNPDDPRLIDPKFLEHPFDQRLAIESVRDTRAPESASYD